MNRTPNIPRIPNIKNRSTKNVFLLTRSGMKMMQNWHRSVGIAAYKPKKAKKQEIAKPENS